MNDERDSATLRDRGIEPKPETHPGLNDRGTYKALTWLAHGNERLKPGTVMRCPPEEAVKLLQANAIEACDADGNAIEEDEAPAFDLPVKNEAPASRSESTGTSTKAKAEDKKASADKKPDAPPST